MKTELENTKLPNKICCRCGKFRGYYTKELSHFSRARLGYCKAQEKVVENMATCENWCSGNNRLFVSKKTSMRVLSELLTNIAAIRQILQEAQEEDKQQNESFNL